MSLLTPAERRGAWLIACLLLAGTLWDLFQAGLVQPRPFDHRGAPGMQFTAPPADTLRNDSGMVDLNRASEADLRRLPGIGPVLARRIVAYRASQGGFHRVEELLAVRGIGPALLQRLEGRLRVSTRP